MALYILRLFDTNMANSLVPSWLIYFLLPDVVAGIIMLVIWLLTLLLEAGLFSVTLQPG